MDCAFRGKSIAPWCLEGNIDIYAVHAPLSNGENNEVLEELVDTSHGKK